MAAQWGQRAEEGERVLHGGQAPFIAGRGGGRRVVRRRNRWWTNGGRKPWAWQVSGGHGLAWSVRSEHGRSVVRTGRLTGGPSGFDIFLELSNWLKHGN
jgi:hypothetical protein